MSQWFKNGAYVLLYAVCVVVHVKTLNVIVWNIISVHPIVLHIKETKDQADEVLIIFTWHNQVVGSFYVVLLSL